MPATTAPPRPIALRVVAYASAALLGCTTVRTPVSTIAPTVPIHEGRVDPQVELWLEGNRPATPEESARASAEAQQAVAEALAGRTVTDPDQLLVVRVQGVSRTPGRRSDQHAAVAGIVVGAVVIVAAVVILIVAESKGGGGGGHAPSLPGVGGGRSGAGRHFAHAVPLPIPRGGRPPRFAPGHVHRSPDVAVGVYVAAPVPMGPAEPAPPDAYLRAQPPPQRPAGVDAPPAAETDHPPAPEPAETAPAALAELELPPPPPLALAERGFFEGDSVVIEGLVVDRATGRPVWQKVLERPADPRDRKAMRGVVDALLAEQGWAPAAP